LATWVWNKIRLINGSKKYLGADFKPVTAQISLWENNPIWLNSQHPQTKLKKKAEWVKKQKNQQSYYRGPKHVELSFEEELDVDNIYKENTILDQQKIQKYKRPVKRHQRQNSGFEEDGKENLSSEGDEHESHIHRRTANQPKIQQEKFNDLNKKFSRNGETVTHFKTDKITYDEINSLKGSFMSQKSLNQKSKHANYAKVMNQQMRKMIKQPSNNAGLNRSRNRIRHSNSSENSNMEIASSSILSDKLRDTLTTLNTRKEVCKRYSKNLKTMEQEMDQDKIRKKKEIKDKLYVGHSAVKNNINDLISQNIARTQNKSLHHSKLSQKGTKRQLKNSKNQFLNNKENHVSNKPMKKMLNDQERLGNTEVYNLNQYWSQANLNVFGCQNFSLPQNMILSKNRSRDVQGFGSPTLRKVNIEREKSRDAFDSIMAKHGLLKDLNNLNSFNAFCKQSPLRHQRSLDYCYQSINSLCSTSGQFPTHMKTWTQHNLNFDSRKENSGSPSSIIHQFSLGVLNNNLHGMGGTTDSGPGYSFPFQRRARSASPPKDPDINEKIAATLSPKHNRENTSAVDDLFEDQVMGLQDPLRSQNSIHTRIGSGSFKSRKPILASTKFFVLGGNSGCLSNRKALIEDKNPISTDKMKVLSKAISHYLNGEYDKIMDEDELLNHKIIENDIITHDLRDHDISDANEHDLTDEGITNKWEVDDWLNCDEKSNPEDNSLESKNWNGFDPFDQPKVEDYQSQRSLYKNKRNRHSKQQIETVKEISNESIMQIIQNCQKVEEKPVSNSNHMYFSLADKKEPEQIEKNIIVDDADLELENCLEGEEWMFKTFNRKKLQEQTKFDNPETEQEDSQKLNGFHTKPPQPHRVGRDEEQDASVKESELTIDVTSKAEKPRRRKKNR
jgi:hypothetical protein